MTIPVESLCSSLRQTYPESIWKPGCLVIGQASNTPTWHTALLSDSLPSEPTMVITEQAEQRFLNAPEVLADFVFRSIHTNVLVGKELTHKFFGVPHTKSYYLGCSTGGRQGLKSVQDFPEDFDGIVAGAAAADHNHLQAWSASFFLITGPPDAPSFLTIDQWINVIHPDVLRQCDEIDGVKDGIIEVPDLCEYDPSGLVCREEGGQQEQNASCITAEQAKMVKEVYKPLFIFGKFAYPRFQFGAEGAMSPLLFGGQVSTIAADWFRFVTFSDPNFNVSTLNQSSWALIQKQDNFSISTWKANISTFKNRNGKLLTYHGQTDQLISPINSERYYSRVQKHMDLTLEEQDTFYRLFRISGMNHCAGGPGAWEVGQTLDGAADDVRLGSLSLGPEKNVLTAMVRWVEEGVAPDTILGTKFVNDDPRQGVQFSRRHCRFPLKTTYDGIGDPTEPESWSCQ
ncbi:hypothetical protein D9758_016678 [Tetrapyrgos nigripes]|uniref:Carboxylic ester hydrolase n=1 Tax=Tetrapyrgos nigripes TaxID=182062 RepID=A0A8H5C9D3_9AGAR|nr:hypothetical protein D9758_016678 [Tetrapyrgos nigripes]